MRQFVDAAMGVQPVSCAKRGMLVCPASLMRHQRCPNVYAVTCGPTSHGHPVCLRLLTLTMRNKPIPKLLCTCRHGTQRCSSKGQIMSLCNCGLVIRRGRSCSSVSPVMRRCVFYPTFFDHLRHAFITCSACVLIAGAGRLFARLRVGQYVRGFDTRSHVADRTSAHTWYHQKTDLCVLQRCKRTSAAVCARCQGAVWGCAVGAADGTAPTHNRRLPASLPLAR